MLKLILLFQVHVSKYLQMIYLYGLNSWCEIPTLVYISNWIFSLFWGLWITLLEGITLPCLTSWHNHIFQSCPKQMKEQLDIAEVEIRKISSVWTLLMSHYGSENNTHHRWAMKKILHFWCYCLALSAFSVPYLSL